MTINDIDTGTEHRGDRGVSLGVFSGYPFYPLDPLSHEIEIEDIAQSLAKQCRFNGHTKVFYSVAQHSVYVSEQFDDVETALWGLLHDAAEAYTGDCVRPIKKTLRDDFKLDWDVFETPIMQAVAKRYQLTLPMPEAIHHADAVLLATEKRDVLNPQKFPWGPLPEPLVGRIEGWSWPDAYRLFTWRFNRLMERRG